MLQLAMSGYFLWWPMMMMMIMTMMINNGFVKLVTGEQHGGKMEHHFKVALDDCLFCFRMWCNAIVYIELLELNYCYAIRCPHGYNKEAWQAWFIWILEPL